MYTNYKIYLLVLILQSFQGLEIGIQLNAHVRLDKNHKPETLSSILKQKKDDRLMKVDIYLKYPNQQGNDMIRYLRIDNFNPLLPMNIVVCPLNVVVAKLKAPSQLKSSCIVDDNTSIYMNQSQESLVEIQRTQEKQRYMYGGLKYLTSLTGSDQLQNPNSQKLMKQIFKQNLEKAHKQKTMNIQKEEQKIEELYRDSLLEKTYINNLQYYQFLKSLADDSSQHRYCKIDISNIESSDIQAVSTRVSLDNNYLIFVVDTDIQNVQVQIPQQQDYIQHNLLQQQFEDAGIYDAQQYVDYSQQQSVNLELDMVLQQDSIGFQIQQQGSSQGANNNLQQEIQNEYLSLNQLADISSPIQVMACNGLQKLEKKQNTLSSYSTLSCNKIAEFEGLLVKNQNDKQQLEQRSQNIDLKINDFKLVSAFLKGAQNMQKVQITGFKNNCDLLLDTILGALFVLCYLTYSTQGNLFKFLTDVQQEQQGQQFMQVFIQQGEKLQDLKLSSISNKRRILPGGRKFKPWECILVNLICSPCLIYVNVCVFCLVICCNGTDCACIYFTRTDDFGLRRALPKSQQEQQQQQQNLMKSFQQIEESTLAFVQHPAQVDQTQQGMERTIGEMDMNQFREYLDQQQELQNMLNHLNGNINVMIQRNYNTDQQQVQIDDQNVNANNLAQEIMQGVILSEQDAIDQEDNEDIDLFAEQLVQNMIQSESPFVDNEDYDERILI